MVEEIFKDVKRHSWPLMHYLPHAVVQMEMIIAILIGGK